jgi:cell division initiation protein
MIDLTPLDVRKKKEDFKRAVRGYDTEQVESFLDLAADRLEQLVGEERRLADRVTSLEDQLARYQEREQALNEALLAAQELREEARSQAERDASLRLREAETHAEAILLDADQAIRHAQRRLEDLQARRGHLLRSYRNLIDRFGEFIDLEEARLDAEPEDLKDLLERLDGDHPGDEEEAGAEASTAPDTESAAEAPFGETVRYARAGDSGHAGAPIEEVTKEGHEVTGGETEEVA